MEARLGKPGTREYVQVLRLLEDFRLDHVSSAVQDALRLGAIGFDAVKHLVLCRLDHRPARLDLARYPHLPVARVGIVRLIRLDPKNLQSRTIRLQVDATRPGRRLGLV